MYFILTIGRSVDALIVAYDLTSRESFEVAKEWIEHSRNHDIRVRILVGTKKDYLATCTQRSVLQVLLFRNILMLALPIRETASANASLILHQRIATNRDT